MAAVKRFFKLLGVAWFGSVLIGEGLISGLGFALPIAVVTWLLIRKHDPEEFELNSKPTFALLLTVGVLGWGNLGRSALSQNVSPNEAAFGGLISMAGVLILVGIVGLIRARSYPSEAL